MPAAFLYLKGLGLQTRVSWFSLVCLEIITFKGTSPAHGCWSRKPTDRQLKRDFCLGLGRPMHGRNCFRWVRSLLFASKRAMGRCEVKSEFLPSLPQADDLARLHHFHSAIRDQHHALHRRESQSPTERDRPGFYVHLVRSGWRRAVPRNLHEGTHWCDCPYPVKSMNFWL